MGSNGLVRCIEPEMTHVNLPDPEQLAARILRGERAAVASGLNLLDNKLAQARNRAVRLLACLSGERWLNQGHLVGVTGPPGAGKSSLVSAMIREWRLSGRTVGVLAVDPSSRPEAGGGALLGDRIRIKTSSHDEGLFIRSLANRNQLGGVATEVWPMSWLMMTCFDIVVIETVGVGQTELDIIRQADTTVVALVPESGDSVQAMKAGLMEVADIFVVNKADRDGAHALIADIRFSVHLHETSGAGPRDVDWEIPVLAAQAANDVGIVELMDAIKRHRAALTRAGALDKRRQARRRAELEALLAEELAAQVMAKVHADPELARTLEAVTEGAIDAYSAVARILSVTLGRP